MIFDLIGVNWLFNIFEDYIYITVRTLAFQIISLVLLFVFVQTPEDYLIYAGLIVFANAGANIFNIFYGRNFLNRNCITDILKYRYNDVGTLEK